MVWKKMRLNTAIIIEGDSLLIMDWLQNGYGSAHPKFLKTINEIKGMQSVQFEVERC